MITLDRKIKKKKITLKIITISYIKTLPKSQRLENFRFNNISKNHLDLNTFYANWFQILQIFSFIKVEE